MAEGILAVWTDVPPEREAAFDEWYNRQHLAERRDAPGFLSAARYRAISGRPRFLAWYRLESPDVLSAPGYRRLLDEPTPETRAIMPQFRRTIRAPLRVAAAAGRGMGGVMATLRIRPAAGRDGMLEERIAAALPDIAAVPGLLSAELWRRAEERVNDSAEAVLRGPDATLDLAVAVQAADAGAARAAIAASLGREALRAAGAAAVTVGLYRLLAAM